MANDLNCSNLSSADYSAAQLTNDHSNNLATAMMNVVNKSTKNDTNVVTTAKVNVKDAASPSFEKRNKFLRDIFNSKDDLKRAAIQVDLAIARSE